MASVRRLVIGGLAALLAGSLVALGPARAGEATTPAQGPAPRDVAATATVKLPAGARPSSVSELGWPSSTRSAVARGATHVWATPARRIRLGRLTRGTRVAVDAIIATAPAPPADRKRRPTRTNCWAWLPVAPTGWVCADDVTASDEAPEPVPLATPALAGYVSVGPHGAQAYATLDDAVAGRAPTALAAKLAVSVTHAETIGDVRYHATDHGWVATRELVWVAPARFAGLPVEAAPSWPFAWALARPRGTIKVKRAPDGAAATVAKLARRALVPVLEQRRGWVRIGDDAWVRATELGVARTAPRPAGVGADERWVDIDLDQQVLVSYEGDRPVFATLVSTGKDEAYRTPLGVFRLARKQSSARMRSPTGAVEDWDVENVPWVMHFKKLFALHGAHWHDAYGKKFSHGCVNMSPRDAGLLFRWTSPAVPDGWADLEDNGAPGTAIRIRSRYRPDPPWRDFEGTVIPAPAP